MASSAVPKLGSRLRPRNQAHFCGAENEVNFLDLASDLFSRQGSAFKANDEFMSSTFGVDSDVLRLLWFSYGGAILKAKLTATHLLWLLSYAKLYIPWITISRFWGVGKDKFKIHVERLSELLVSVMDEVQSCFLMISICI
jgi:hypothetical protein